MLNFGEEEYKIQLLWTRASSVFVLITSRRTPKINWGWWKNEKLKCSNLKSPETNGDRDHAQHSSSCFSLTSQWNLQSFRLVSTNIAAKYVRLVRLLRFRLESHHQDWLSRFQHFFLYFLLLIHILHLVWILTRSAEICIASTWETWNSKNKTTVGKKIFGFQDWINWHFYSERIFSCSNRIFLQRKKKFFGYFHEL